MKDFGAGCPERLSAFFDCLILYYVDFAAVVRAIAHANPALLLVSA